ncbi:MAG: hypothetical protein WCR27_10515, partial [Eubacteriales bacterium]
LGNGQSKDFYVKYNAGVDATNTWAPAENKTLTVTVDGLNISDGTTVIYGTGTNDFVTGNTLRF